MQQPAAFFRSWRKKGLSPTQGSRSPTTKYPSPFAGLHPHSNMDAPSPDGQTRFFRIFKGNYAGSEAGSFTETAQIPFPPRPSLSPDSLGCPQVSSPSRLSPSSSERTPPLSSPHSFDRPLPPVPPSRPPRPPSLNLDLIDLTVPGTPSAQSKSRRSVRKPCVGEAFMTKREMPELDHVWENFMKDVQGENVANRSTVNRSSPIASDGSRHGVHVILDPHATHPPRPTLYRAWGSESTPYLTSSSGQTSDSGSDNSSEDTDPENTGFSLSLFPSPPPLPTRRRIVPKPLVLLPTPTIAPLPPSPSSSSRDSTPLATPTTPRYADPGSLPSARKSACRPSSILKKSGSPLTPRSVPDTPTAPTSTTERRSNVRAAHIASPPRLRSAQSVPHLQAWVSNAHRNVASDSVKNTDRRVSGRRQWHSNTQSCSTPPASEKMEWGYAI